MTQTLISRVNNSQDYNSNKKEFLWTVNKPSQWKGVYGKLNVGDNAIIVGSDKLYGKLFFGLISKIINGESVLFSDIQELEVKNDDLLKIHEIYPELIPIVKANFPAFIHPKEIDINSFIDAVKNKRFVNFYIFKNLSSFESNRNLLKENDRVILLDANKKFESLKIYRQSRLIDYSKEINVDINVVGKTLSDILNINKAAVTKRKRSNNVERIENIIETLNGKDYFKFNTFFSYYDCLFNKRVYKKNDSKINELELGLNENIYKISMGLGGDIDDESYSKFVDKGIVIIHKDTKAMGITSQSQAETFTKIEIGDYFYLCRGNSYLELIGRITSKATPCKDEGWENWLERSFEIVVDAINENSYEGEQRWWTPNANSTCIKISSDNISEANRLIFEPFFNLRFIRNNDTKTIIYKHSNMPLNQILYGPPGTGKTYNTVDKAVEIIKGSASSDHGENKKQFDVLRQEGQIKFVTFHQNYSYEDFMVGIKPDIDNDKLIFKYYKGIFYELAKRARENYIAHKNNTGSSKDFDDIFSEIIAPLVVDDESVSIKMKKGADLVITNVTGNTIHFNKPNGSSQHTLSIQTLEDLVEGIRKPPSGLAAYYNPIVDMIRDKKKTDGTPKIEELKNYVLVIDEINRANISKVFGELITLIEDDKRLGAKNELKISLSNGEEDFSVPPNLYIIGTMNTADKSIALIDVALRRRFEFVGYYPKYAGYSKEAVDLLKEINDSIFEKKKSADYLIGHAYFMDDQPILSVLQNKVLPLLMEYFSGKREVVQSVFEKTNWNVDYDTVTYNWNISKK